jgi:DNA helicase-2/ATP-dependent DNA helicase PcrA
MEEAFLADGLEGEERLENVKELVTLATKYDAMEQMHGIEKMLEEAALASDQDEIKEEQNAVKLMTIHAAKGLEFNHVFITGLEQGLFPHERMGDKKDDDEEERRLFYVALTRARTQLYLSCASIRTIFGQKQVGVPSEFISDISTDLIEQEERKITSSARDIFIDF